MAYIRRQLPGVDEPEAIYHYIKNHTPDTFFTDVFINTTRVPAVQQALRSVTSRELYAMARSAITKTKLTFVNNKDKGLPGMYLLLLQAYGAEIMRCHAEQIIVGEDRRAMIKFRTTRQVEAEVIRIMTVHSNYSSYSKEYL